MSWAVIPPTPASMPATSDRSGLGKYVVRGQPTQLTERGRKEQVARAFSLFNYLRTSLSAWIFCSVREMVAAALFRRPDGPLLFHRTQWRAFRARDIDEGGRVARTVREDVALTQLLRRDSDYRLEIQRDDASPAQAPVNIAPSYLLVDRLRIAERLFVTRMLAPMLATKADAAQLRANQGGPWVFTLAGRWQWKCYPMGDPVPDGEPVRRRDAGLIVVVEILSALDPEPLLRRSKPSPPAPQGSGVER